MAVDTWRGDPARRNLPDLLFWCFFSSASLFLVSLTAFRLPWLHQASYRRAVCPLFVPDIISTHKKSPDSVACCFFASGRLIRKVVFAAESSEIAKSVVSRHKRLCSMVFLRRECLHRNSLLNAQRQRKCGDEGSCGQRGNFRIDADHQRVDISRHPVLRDAHRALHRQRLEIGICTCTFTVCYCNLYKYQG